MKIILSTIIVFISFASKAQIWKVLPKGVRAIGYRNVETSPISENFNSSGQKSSLGTSFRIDSTTLNNLTENLIAPNLDQDAYDALVVGEYDIDAEAKFNVHGLGFGYGITDKIMFYGELAFYKAQVKVNIKRTRGNTFEDVARILETKGGTENNIYAANIRQMVDANEGTIQSVITNYYGYRPLGDWYGSGYGDMETGLMINLADQNSWGLMIYPGVILPTGREDDPNTLQDVGFGDGQLDLFTEMATGYIVNDHLSFGTTLRYTYQSPGNKTLRIPHEKDFELSIDSGNFSVKYGDRINWSVNSTLTLNDWLSFTPAYRFMYQEKSQYDSPYSDANLFLADGSQRSEHQVQLTTTLSSITPFLKKKFLLPAQINLNLVRTVGGRNVPNINRFEMEFRMIF